MIYNQVYDPSIIPPLVATLRLAISARKSICQYLACAVLALTVRRPETFRHFLDAAGKYSRLLLFDFFAYICAEKEFVITSLDTTAAEPELAGSDGHSGKDIVVIQLNLKD